MGKEIAEAMKESITIYKHSSMMKEEIFRDLMARYKMGKDIFKAMEKAEGVFAYDLRLVTISIKDIDEDDSDAQRAFEVRVRKEDEDGPEQLVIVASKHGAVRDVTDITEDLKDTASLLETLTEGLVGEFDDKVLVWNWLGD